jgi:hypothetical protein
VALAGNRQQRLGANDERAKRASDELVRLGVGENPWRENPGRGCGVKQTHKAGGGANHRGREKRRGWKAVGLGSPSQDAAS